MARSRIDSPNAAPWRWAWAGLLSGLLAGFLWFLPAQWLATVVQQSTGGQVLLADARGTVWTGSAQLVFAGGAGSSDRAAMPGRLYWQLRPRLIGLKAVLAAECCMAAPVALQARWRPGGLGVVLEDSLTEWPAALLAGLGTPWNTLQVDGNLRLSTQGLSVEWAEGRLAVAGRAELLARDIASRLSTLRPMGSYRITLQGGPTPALRLETLEGSLQLSGNGSWVGSRLRFTGEASSAPDREAALSNLLNIIGRRNGPRSVITIG